MKKRILALVLAVCLVVGMLPMVVFAEDTATEEPAAKPSVNLNFYTYSQEAETTASITVNAGDGALYWVTKNVNSAKPENYYMVTCKADDEWNVKLEYPIEGIPTLTLRNATLVDTGLTRWAFAFAGAGTYMGSEAFDGDVKVVLEGKNTLTNGSVGGYSILRFNITGTATITGSGSLVATHTMDSDKFGIIHSDGNLVFDHTTVEVIHPASSRNSHGVVAKGGDITVNGGSLKVFGYATTNATRPLIYALWATKNAEGKGGNLNVTDGAKVKAYASAVNDRVPHYQWTQTTTDAETGETTTTTKKPQAKGTVRLEGAINISDSDIEFSVFGQTYLAGLEIYNIDLQNPNIGTVINADYDSGYTVYVGSSAGKYSSTAADQFTAPTSGLKTYTNSVPDFSATTTNPKYFAIKHTCVAGEPTYEPTVPGAACKTVQIEVKTCTICGEEMSREAVDLEGEPTKIHTPGKKTLVSKTDAKREQIKNSAGNWIYRVDDGKYVYNVTCAVCGETYPEEEVIEPGIFWWDNVGTYGGMNDTANSTSLNVTVLSAGQTKYFQTVSAEDATYTNRYKVVEVDITTLDDPENWNIKLEYPEQGHPIMTMKNATLNVQSGIYYGAGVHVSNVPLTIVLEGENTITTGTTRSAANTIGKYSTYHGALNFNTTADVTITSNGTGSLSILDENHVSDRGSIQIRKGGNLIFDNANITWNSYDPTDWPLTLRAIFAEGADVTVNGGNLSIFVNDTYGSNGLGAAFYATKNEDGTAGGNVTIQKDANVKVAVSSYTYNTIVTEGDFILKDSTVELASIGKKEKTLFAEAPVLDYLSDDYTIVASTVQAGYDKENDVLTAPTTGLVEIAEDTDWTSLLYFKITPAKKYADLTAFGQDGVAMESSLSLMVLLPKTVEPDGEGYVEFTKAGVVQGNRVKLTSFPANTKNYMISYPGIAAAEMKDVITITVYDQAEGGKQLSQVYSTSIYKFAMENLATTTNAKFKTLMVDLLNYGAMAQVLFGHNTENLANADLTPEEWENASKVGTYASNAPTATTSDYQTAAFSLESKIVMNMLIKNTNLGADCYAVVTVDGDTKEYVVRSAQTIGARSMFRFENMAPALARSTVTWKFYKASDDPATAEPTLVVTDSLENWVGRSLATNPQYEELMMYCDAAADYMKNK